MFAALNGVFAALFQRITGVFATLNRHVCRHLCGEISGAKYRQKAGEFAGRKWAKCGRKRVICDAFAAHLQRKNARISVVFPRENGCISGVFLTLNGTKEVHYKAC